MKLHRPNQILDLFIVFLSVQAMPLSFAFASDGGKNSPKSHIVRGEAKTLPQGVTRFRALYRASEGNSAFTPAGHLEKSGYQIRLQTSAYVVEAGLTPRFSIQVLLPTVHLNHLSLDGNQFQKSAFYFEKYNDFVKVISEKLVSDGLCANLDACQIAINEKALSLPFDATTILPTGEELKIRAGVPLKTIASALIVNAAAPSDGRTGVGDLEIGSLFAFADPDVGVVTDWPFLMSLGLGVRIPTGSFNEVPTAQRSTGRGTTDLGVRVNVDKYFNDELVLSWQNQTELMLIPGKKKRSSLLNNQSLNSADPTSAGGDGQRNEGEFKRESSRQLGFFKFSLGVSQISPALSFIILNSQFKYDFDPAASVSGLTSTPKSSVYAGQFGLTLDGLRHEIPLQFDLDYEIPLAGENKLVVARNLIATLKAYYRF